MAKIKVNELSKELGVKSADLVELLKNTGSQVKGYSSVLSDMDMNIILEHFTKLYDDGTDVYEFMKSLCPVKVEEPKEEVKEEVKAYAEKKAGAPVKEAGEKPNRNTEKRYVDTRANVVDLSKYNDSEKIEELAPELKDTVTNKQKIKKGQKNKMQQQKNTFVPKKEEPKKKEKLEIEIPDEIIVSDLAERLKTSVNDVIKRLMLIGVMANVNQAVDFDTASLIAEDMGAIVTKEIIVTKEDVLFNDTEDAPEDLLPRDPVVVVMGHVDHGKTSLLDAIRETNVASGEAGGITQHIGAYRVKINDRQITFLDTPGHEAFTAMRARGAQVTDIAILVVAADDGIMPQTVEAINHAKAAGLTTIVAINKIDRENADVARVKRELSENDILIEEWGGDTVCVEVSAKQRINIEGLLEMVILSADILELKANPNRKAKGTVIESRLDKGRGPVATVLVQRGTLKQGDIVVAGTSVGKVRVMTDDKGNKIKEAGPSVPVEIVGLSETPDGGEIFFAVDDERAAREVVEARKQKIKDEAIQAQSAVNLDDLFAQISQGDVKTLNLIVKADVQGSVEAVRQSLEKLSNEEVKVKVIHGAVGGVNESDVMLASASNAIIVGFNVRPDGGARVAAEAKGIEMRMYRIIYDAIDEIEAAMKGMLAPKFREKVTGHAEVRQTFKVSSVGTIAGCYVTDGVIQRNNQVRVVRNGIVIYEGAIDSLKRFKDDAKEVASGFECGMSIEKFNDIKEGDVFESFTMEEVER
ncbi:MAG: translation initiation factor IF-2 [Clostridia bacterium]|nr:translation initiation factor IF-2 [Clostridia bacterium]